MAFIEAKDYRYSYADSEKYALNIPSLCINKGELVLMTGYSGSGKTTLLRRICDLTGIRGRAEGAMTTEAEDYGYVWQNPSSQIVCDEVGAEIVFGMENRGFGVEAMKRRLAEVCTFFGITDLVDKKTHEISSGEMQLVNIAAAMALKPDMLLLDEPLSSLDPYSSERIVSILKKIHDGTDTTIIISEQKPEKILDLADRVIVMDGGEIIFNGDKTDVDQSDSDIVLSYFGKEKQIADSDISKANDPAIRIKNAYFRYKKNGNDILKKCDFELADNSITALVGGNGTGKTTLSQIIAGYIKPYSGKVYGSDKSISYLPAIPEYVFENDYPLSMSEGEKEKAAIDIVLNKNADIYILDEPTKGLDPKVKKELAQRLISMRRGGKTILIVTHDISFAATCSDYMAMLFDGEVVVCERKEEFLEGNLFYTI